MHRDVAPRAWACLLVLLSVVAMSGLAATPARSAEMKTISGELICPDFQWVERIWFQGSKSGWHGMNVPKENQPRTIYDNSKRRIAKYSFTGIKGEFVKVWLDCSQQAERYSEFTIGNGSTRHICAWRGWAPCGPISWGSCALKAILGSRIGLIACFLRG